MIGSVQGSAIPVYPKDLEAQPGEVLEEQQPAVVCEGGDCCGIDQEPAQGENPTMGELEPTVTVNPAPEGQVAEEAPNVTGESQTADVEASERAEQNEGVGETPNTTGDEKLAKQLQAREIAKAAVADLRDAMEYMREVSARFDRLFRPSWDSRPLLGVERVFRRFDDLFDRALDQVCTKREEGAPQPRIHVRVVIRRS